MIIEALLGETPNISRHHVSKIAKNPQITKLRLQPGPIPKNKAFMDASIDKLRGKKGFCGNIIGLEPYRIPSMRSKYNPNKSQKFALLGALLLFVRLSISYE
ncbi:hypothetical protein LguiB_001923 [Lonicera macranthoides]